MLKELPSSSRFSEFIAWLGRLVLSLIVPLVAFVRMWRGFIFLRDAQTPKLVTALVAILWGVAGVGLLFAISNWVVERLPNRWRSRLQPFVFIGPGMVVLTWYLVLPVLRTFYQSFFVGSKEVFGFDNYIYAFTHQTMQESFRNNLIWLVVGTGLSVAFGLLIAILADRSKFEKIAKSIVFLPMAISFVGAGIIWRFIYYYKPPGEEQIGLLNAIVAAMGGDPVAWITFRPWNTIFLVIIMVWLQTGFATVLISAALKGVPEELLEAARIDGGNEIQIFFQIILPYIRGTIITVSTTIIIATLKIFDIVFVMTNGNYGTEVIASMQYKQMFKFHD
ncbi:MAG: sugar ABC transporter permease, partial [Anaerolineaceae bacterium]|nr:sugar ABC transporter permease [Anaerolineaceae bacterium]